MSPSIFLGLGVRRELACFGFVSAMLTSLHSSKLLLCKLKSV